jgi:hypothetical protein
VAAQNKRMKLSERKSISGRRASRASIIHARSAVYLQRSADEGGA